MTSVNEKIDQIRTDEAVKKAEEDAEMRKRTERREKFWKSLRNLFIQPIQDRHDRKLSYAQEVASRVFSESGVLAGIQELEGRMANAAGYGRKHYVEVREYQAVLRLQVGDDHIVSAGFDFDTNDVQRSYIHVVVSITNEDLYINDHLLSKDVWKSNRERVQDLLARAYLHPKIITNRIKSKRPHIDHG